MKYIIVIALSIFLYGCGQTGGYYIGTKGDTGATGSSGSKGDNGDKGDAGPQGPMGNQGPQGTAGINGSMGPTGPTGETGQSGVQIVPLCPSISGAYPELLFRIADKLYGVYYDSNGAHETEVIPGSYCTTDGRHCCFSVNNDLNVIY